VITAPKNRISGMKKPAAIHVLDFALSSQQTIRRMSNVRTTNCPNCNHAVELPQQFRLAAWRKLACSACGTKLELAGRRAPLFLAPLGTLPALLYPIQRLAAPPQAMFWMGALLGIYATGLIAVAIFWRWESRHPVLRIRKIPAPEIALNLSLKSPENIRTLR
jgi:hypothetical protein